MENRCTCGEEGRGTRCTDHVLEGKLDANHSVSTEADRLVLYA